MELTWYTYFSWWIFIWFLFFKAGLTNFTPYPIYCFVVVFILLKFIRDIIYFTFYDDKKIKNYDLILGWVLFIIALDIIPFFFLKPRIDKESILFTLLLGLLYCFCMEKWRINIINHYTVLNYRELSDKYTLDSFYKEVFSI